MQKVATGAVLNTFWFARRARGVQQEQGVFCRNPFWFASVSLTGDGIVHPDVTAFGHGDGRTRTLNHQHLADAFAAAERQGFVHNRLQRQLLAAAYLVIRSDDHFGTSIIDPVTQALCRETTEHH